MVGTEVGVVAEVSTAAAVASTVVALMEVATMVVGLTAAIAAGVRCTAVAADMEGWAEGRHRRGVPVEEERGPRRAEAFGTPRRDGIRLRDQVAAEAEMVQARPAFTPQLRMDSGTPSEEPMVRLDRG
jgi:hypothetical protein